MYERRLIKKDLIDSKFTTSLEYLVVLSKLSSRYIYLDYDQYKVLNSLENIKFVKQIIKSNIDQYLSLLNLFSKLNFFKLRYLQYDFDYSGRVYPRSGFNFSHYNSDLIRSFFVSSNYSKVSDENDFLFSGANDFGFDRVDNNEKIKFIDSNENKIIKSGEDPIKNRFWTKAKNPFRFLSFCRNYIKYIHNEKINYLCSIDASCNSFQILSSITNNKIIKELTNVTSSSYNDLYSELSKYIYQKYNIVLNREDIKDIFKTIPFNGTKFSITKQLIYKYPERSFKDSFDIINDILNIDYIKQLLLEIKNININFDDDDYIKIDNRHFSLRYLVNQRKSYNISKKDNSIISIKPKYKTKLDVVDKKINKRKMRQIYLPTLIHNYDANILIETISNLYNFYLLPIHDSFLVDHRFTKFVKKEYKKAFKLILGLSDNISDNLIN